MTLLRYHSYRAVRFSQRLESRPLEGNPKPSHGFPALLLLAPDTWVPELSFPSANDADGCSRAPWNQDNEAPWELRLSLGPGREKTSLITPVPLILREEITVESSE